MPGFNNSGKAIMLGALRAEITHISIHTDNPSTTGTQEVSGGGYARWAVDTGDFNTVSGGAFTTNKDHEFSGPANEDATHVGIWDGSTFLGGGAITGDNLFNAEGKFILQSGTSFNLNA